MKKDQFELAGAEQFFEFMEVNGAAWWFCEAQPRKLNGERGAPIASKFGMRLAFNHARILNAFEQLSSRLERLGKSQIDLQTRESPSKFGGFVRVLLIDDVVRYQLDEIRAFWPGPLSIIETSPENFQSFLISPRGLTADEYLKCAQFLASRFGGDLNAARPRQLHRFPGSPNWKPSIVSDGRPFITRLIACFEGEEGFDLADQLDEMLGGSAAAPARPRAVRQARPGVGDNSSAAFAWTLRQLDLGTPHDAILAGLQTRWLGHHDAKDWPARTLHNALHARGARTVRYSAGNSLGSGNP